MTAILKPLSSEPSLIKDLLANETLKQVVTRVNTLPSLPALYLELMEALKSERCLHPKVGEPVGRRSGSRDKAA
jgi:hypothetical protein